MSKLNKEELLERIAVLLRERYGPPAYKEKHHNTAVSILEMMSKKPEVTEEWIEEKAREMMKAVWQPKDAKDFIGSLIMEVVGK